MRAFVTGGTGFLGRRLLTELLEHGYAVSALVRTFERARQLPAGVQPVPGDVTKRDSLRAGLRGAAVVFHLAGLRAFGARPAEAERMERINVQGTRNVLEMAAEAGVQRIVYTSTVAVYGPATDPVDETFQAEGSIFQSEYERTKYLAHYQVAVPLQAQGAPITIVSPGMVYGPGDGSQWAQLLRAYLQRRLPVMVGPDNRLTWAHVGDIAAGHRLAAEGGPEGETYILAGPTLTHRQFFAACEQAGGPPAPRVWLPAESTDAVARVLQKFNPGLTELLRSVAGVSFVARADKARRELDWVARPLETGLPETLDWLRETPR